MLLSDLWVGLLLSAGAFAASFFKKLSPFAAITGLALGYFIFKGGGYISLLLLTSFFLLGTFATSWGLRQKQSLGIAEERSGRRTAGQVWANAGVAGIAGLAAVFFPEKNEWFRLMIAGSFSAATADTLSSELGNLYGRRFYNLLTLKKDHRGENGVVSLEGTLCGVAGSIIIAGIFSVSAGYRFFGWIVVAGTVGNLVDSILGATLERRGWLGNNAVNFLNTLAGAVVAVAYYTF